MGFPLHLDHASLHVVDFSQALERLSARFGLVATRTPAAPDWHSRLFLDRSYVEVSARPGREAPPGWSVPLFFLRYESLPSLLDHLRAAGLSPSLSEHAGVDGTWQDVELDAPEGEAAPILVRRTQPPELAADWPPPLGSPQPCGAFALAAVHLWVARLEPTLDFYRRLLAFEALPAATVDGSFGGKRIELPLASGRLVLHPIGPSGAVSPGVAGISLAVPSLSQAEQALKERGAAVRRASSGAAAELWIDSSETSGVRIGFRESGPG